MDIHNDVNHISNVTGRFDPAQDVGPSATGNSSALSCGLPLSFRSTGQKSRFNKTIVTTMKLLCLGYVRYTERFGCLSRSRHHVTRYHYTGRHFFVYSKPVATFWQNLGHLRSYVNTSMLGAYPWSLDYRTSLVFERSRFRSQPSSYSL